jgi:hypothetical protein
MATLCTGCTRELAGLLLLAASIGPDLDDATARLLKRGTGGRSSSPEPPLPVDFTASRAASALRTELVMWAAAIGTVPVPNTIPVLARSLLRDLPAARQHAKSDRMLRGIRHHVAQALDVIDRRPERVPAGTCEACGAHLFAELGDDEVTCRCGTVTTALQERRRERAAAADVLGTAAEISGALARIGISVPRGTITSWASRGRLTPRPGGVYALSDVLALHAQSQARVRG